VPGETSTAKAALTMTNADEERGAGERARELPQRTQKARRAQRRKGTVLLPQITQIAQIKADKPRMGPDLLQPYLRYLW